MNRLLNIVLVVLLLALVPLRGIAAAAHGHCGDASAEYAQAQDDASQSSTHDDGGGEHCAGMSAIPSVSLSLPGDRSEERNCHGAPFVIGFIPEHLDPPPLAR